MEMKLTIPISKDIYWHEGNISRKDRQRQYGHKNFCIWFTGLSGSGKSTIARKLEEKLFEHGVKTYVLDGDNVRYGLSNNLGFSHEDRTENIRRIGEVSKLFVDAGLVVMTAFISPYREDRRKVRALMKEGEFVEVFIDATIETCEARDPKGLYKKAKAGEIKGFTGISAPFDRPENPELIVNTTEETDIEINAEKVFRYLDDNKLLE